MPQGEIGLPPHYERSIIEMPHVGKADRARIARNPLSVELSGDHDTARSGIQPHFLEGMPPANLALIAEELRNGRQPCVGHICPMLDSIDSEQSN